MVWIFRQRPLPLGFGGFDHLFVLNIHTFDHPGRAFADLFGRQHACLDQAMHAHRADLEQICGFFQGDIATLKTLALPIDGNAVRVAEARDPRSCLAILPSGPFARTIEQGGDRLVRHHASKAFDQGLGLTADRPTMLSSPVLLDPKFGMIAALPMEHQMDLVVLDLGNDLVEHGAHDPLSGDRRGTRMVPGGLQIGA